MYMSDSDSDGDNICFQRPTVQQWTKQEWSVLSAEVSHYSGHYIRRVMTTAVTSSVVTTVPSNVDVADDLVVCSSGRRVGGADVVDGCSTGAELHSSDRHDIS